MKSLITFLKVAATVVAVLFVVGTIGVWADRISCEAFSEATGISTKIVVGRCYVEVDGKFIPITLYEKSFERNLNIRMNQ